MTIRENKLTNKTKQTQKSPFFYNVKNKQTKPHCHCGKPSVGTSRVIPAPSRGAQITGCTGIETSPAMSHHHHFLSRNCPTHNLSPYGSGSCVFSLVWHLLRTQCQALLSAHVNIFHPLHNPWLGQFRENISRTCPKSPREASAELELCSRRFCFRGWMLRYI